MYTSQSGNNVKVFIISNWIYGKTIFEYNHLHSDTLGLIIGAFIKSCYVPTKAFAVIEFSCPKWYSMYLNCLIYCGKYLDTGALISLHNMSQNVYSTVLFKYLYLNTRYCILYLDTFFGKYLRVSVSRYFFQNISYI